MNASCSHEVARVEVVSLDLDELCEIEFVIDCGDCGMRWQPLSASGGAVPLEPEPSLHIGGRR
jgi:hypothetical protein